MFSTLLSIQPNGIIGQNVWQSTQKAWFMLYMFFFQVLQVLLSLKIKEIKTEKAEGTKKMKRKEKFQKLSRRDRKASYEFWIIDDVKGTFI